MPPGAPDVPGRPLAGGAGRLGSPALAGLVGLPPGLVDGGPTADGEASRQAGDRDAQAGRRPWGVRQATPQVIEERAMRELPRHAAGSR